LIHTIFFEKLAVAYFFGLSCMLLRW